MHIPTVQQEFTISWKRSSYPNSHNIKDLTHWNSHLHPSPFTLHPSPLTTPIIITFPSSRPPIRFECFDNEKIAGISQSQCEVQGCIHRKNCPHDRGESVPHIREKSNWTLKTEHWKVKASGPVISVRKVFRNVVILSLSVQYHRLHIFSI
jgi:hypothetical protein